MWLFTPFGFYSVVRIEGAKVLTVRARVRADLNRLRRRYLPSLSPTVATPMADYPYRATVSAADLARAAQRIIEDIDYPNFKNAVLGELGEDREALCHGVWEVMREATQARPRSTTRRQR